MVGKALLLPSQIWYLQELSMHGYQGAGWDETLLMHPAHQPPGSYIVYRVSVYNLLCALLGDQGELHRAALLEFTFRQKTDPGHVNKQTL